MTIEEMKRIKDSRGYSFAQLSDYTGVPIITLQRIFAGNTRNPRRATLDAIERVLKGDESIYIGKAYAYEKNSTINYSDYQGRNTGVDEDEMSYGRSDSDYQQGKKNGEYTIEDYYDLPEDRWVELIDGCYYGMNSPQPIHQIISGLFFRTIINFIEKNNVEGVPMYAPVDVQIDQDDRTMVKPDIIIVCDRNKIKKKAVYGAPDFVLEILSPLTRRKDMFVKSDKYCNSGVKEYWMIDPKKKTLIVYNYQDEDFTPVTIPLEGEYPMSIYDGKLKIDLDEIAEAIDNFT